MITPFTTKNQSTFSKFKSHYHHRKINQKHYSFNQEAMSTKSSLTSFGGAGCVSGPILRVLKLGNRNSGKREARLGHLAEPSSSAQYADTRNQDYHHCPLSKAIHSHPSPPYSGRPIAAARPLAAANQTPSPSSTPCTRSSHIFSTCAHSRSRRNPRKLQTRRRTTRRRLAAIAGPKLNGSRNGIRRRRKGGESERGTGRGTRNRR